MVDTNNLKILINRAFKSGLFIFNAHTRQGLKPLANSESPLKWTKNIEVKNIYRLGVRVRNPTYESRMSRLLLNKGIRG